MPLRSKRIVAVVALYLAALAFLILPVLIWLLSTDHDLSERTMIAVVAAAILVQGAATALVVHAFWRMRGDDGG